MAATYTYTRYLSAKTTVDDRALNQHVVNALRAELARVHLPLNVLEVGAGLGTMVARLVDWGILTKAEYYLVDVDRQSLHDAHGWLSRWADSRALALEHAAPDKLRILGDRAAVDVTVHMVCAEVMDFLQRDRPRADLLVANAFLDLIDVPHALPRLLERVAPGGCCWFSINFDGESIFQPDHPSDRALLDVYHRSMDERVRHGRPAGDRWTGRHLFGHLRAAGADILAAGASDWVVHAVDGRYAYDEAYFVDHILHTVEAELEWRSEVDAAELREWLRCRRAQLAAGELVYIAHQLDLLAKRSP